MTIAAPVCDLHPAVAAALGTPERFVTPRGARVVLVEPLGEPVFFVINNRKDRIHKTQLRGHFYEQDVLGVLAGYFPKGGVFVDIGANIGNHTLYMATSGQAARVIPMEPNPASIALLLAMVRLNRLGERVSLNALGYGIGDREASGYGLHDPKGNLGWVRLNEDGGEIEIRTGDSLLGEEPRIDMIKIDVEGMEIKVLSGLKNTLDRHRPTLFVEVDHGNRDAFDRLMRDLHYDVAEEFPRTRMNQNFLMTPEAK